MRKSAVRDLYTSFEDSQSANHHQGAEANLQLPRLWPQSQIARLPVLEMPRKPVEEAIASVFSTALNLLAHSPTQA